MENQGTVESISLKNKACKIDGVWYSFGPLIKTQYVKKGPVEYRTEETEEGLNDLVVFIKSTGSSPPSPSASPASPGKPQFEEGNSHRMSALKFAGNVYTGSGQEDDAKRLADEASDWLEKGVWVTEEKV
jgi:hypothetical protein